jgi:hypothetical protein
VSSFSQDGIGGQIRGIPSVYDKYPKTGSGYIYNFIEREIEEEFENQLSLYEKGVRAYDDKQYDDAENFLRVY